MQCRAVGGVTHEYAARTPIVRGGRTLITVVSDTMRMTVDAPRARRNSERDATRLTRHRQSG